MVPALHVLLTILKILGIVLLVILAVVLILLILVLFVPVRYTAKGQFEGRQVSANANVHWLFHIVSFKVNFRNTEKLHLWLKIPGITIYDNLKEKKAKKPKTKKSKAVKTKKEDIVEENTETIETATEVTVNDDKLDNFENNDIEAKVLSENTEVVIEEKKAGIFSKIAGVFENIKFTFVKICDTIKKVRSNIKFYIKLCNLESTKAAFEQCRKQLFKLLGLLCPRKFKLNLHLGFDDPSTMGEVLAIWGMLYPWHMGRIDIRPEFEMAVMEGNFYAKGHICIVSIIKAVCILYFDRNIKLFIKHYKGNTNISRED